MFAIELRLRGSWSSFLTASTMKTGHGPVVRFKIPQAKKLFARVAVKLVAFLAFLYPLFHAHVLLSGSANPYRRGFFCDGE